MNGPLKEKDYALYQEKLQNLGHRYNGDSSVGSTRSVEPFGRKEY